MYDPSCQRKLCTVSALCGHVLARLHDVGTVYCAADRALPVAGFPNASQEDAKIEKTAKDTQKGLEKSFQNVTPDTSDLPNPFDGAGAGSIADKVWIMLHVLSLQAVHDLPASAEGQMCNMILSCFYSARLAPSGMLCGLILPAS